MNERSGKSESLWQAIGRAQESVVKDPVALERLRAHIVTPSRRSLWTRSFAWTGAALTACAVMLVVWAAPWRQPSFRVGASVGAVGMVLAAKDEHLPVQFADGSQVVLAPGARGRVNRLSETGAEVVLTGGALEAHVVHSAETRWVFHAGPFEILVTGTRFVATWQPQSQTLDVQMTEGSVRVAGGDLGREVAVRAGQRFTASKGAPTYSLRQQIEAPAAPSPAEVAIESNVSAAALVASPRIPAPPQPSPALGEAPEPVRATWATAAAAGDHQRAFSLAQKRGLNKLTKKLDAPGLLLLADTARYVHQPRPAAAAFLALVQRFPRSAEATDAMFGLGRLAFEQTAWPEAAGWFQRVVDQQKQGPLVEAAWGRLMESLVRAHDPLAAQRAQAYLERFPQGQHHALAERIRAGLSR
jgi:hypothetical protein